MHTFILMIGFFLDMLLGDPPRMPHIVVGIGKIITLCERILRPVFSPTPRGERIAGGILATATLTLSVGIPVLVFTIAENIHPAIRFALECLVCCQLLALKSLSEAAMRVHDALARNDLPAARTAVGKIVGRDTAALDATGVIRATVETVAENTSDGVIAPILYFLLGGAPLMLAYKAINTMDSMIGYKNEKYLYFGRVAARLDDVANFIPARLTACLMLADAALTRLGAPDVRLDFRNALRIYRRDRNAHSSPNAGHPEAVCAGALGIQLGGDSTYGGIVTNKPTLGDAARATAPDDIQRAVSLTGGAVFVMLLCVCILWFFGNDAGRITPW